MALRLPRPGPGNSLRVCQIDSCNPEPTDLRLLRRPGEGTRYCGRQETSRTRLDSESSTKQCDTEQTSIMCDVHDGKLMQAPGPEPEGEGGSRRQAEEPRRQTMVVGAVFSRR